MEEEKKLSYKKYGDGVFTNKDDISYYKASQDFEIAQGLLLGCFDDDGKYYVPDEICKELIGLDKLIEETSSNKYFLSARAGDYKFKFEVIIEKKEDKKVAYLYFLENISVAGIINKNYHTLVASYIDDDDINFLFRMKKAFNIFARIEAEGKDMKNMDKASKILILKKDLLNKRNKLYYGRDALDKLYVKEILSILKSAGPAGKRLILMYMEAVRSKNLNKLKVNKYVTLRQILDVYLETGLIEGYFPDKQTLLIREVRNQQMEKSKKVQAEYASSATKKFAGKAKGGGAKKGKAKGGGGAGKGKPANKPSAPNIIAGAGLPSEVYASGQEVKKVVNEKKLYTSIPPLIGLKEKEMTSNETREAVL